MANETDRPRVGIAFQGGVIPAGSFEAGVVRALVETKAFEKYNIIAFSGTSAGALVASVCWGHVLEGKIDKLPDVLKQQWMDMAYGIVPDAQFAQTLMLTDHLARLNPFYDCLAQNIRVPFTRDLMKNWVKKYMNFDAWPQIFAERNKNEETKIPGLLLGTTDVLEGEIKVVKVVGKDDFTLKTVLASGSLDEMNGMTVIRTGPHEGIYLDGAWAINPPISGLIDYGVEQIWIVRIFPKTRERIPATPAERKDRKDELWQNSLVEHELKMIDFVNDWRAALNAGISTPEIATPPRKQSFQEIRIEVIAMERDLPAGSALINTASFIQDMMDYGYHQAHQFMKQK